MSYEFIITKSRGRVGLITLHRPKARNALNNQLLHELVSALEVMDGDAEVGAIVVTGDEAAFAAGADIKEMATKTAAEMLASGFIACFGSIGRIRKPLIAAVSGWALGGGCEIALACDMIVASETAKFGQPEINIGIIPGGGGTQRLPRAVGKSLALEMIMNGRILTAQEALRAGMVNRVVEADRWLDEAIALAGQIAGRAPLAVRAAKRLVNLAFEESLAEGLEREGKEFHALFDSEDRAEGMMAFSEKRQAAWRGRETKTVARWATAGPVRETEQSPHAILWALRAG
jgi:enoyl-CoA hydratase